METKAVRHNKRSLMHLQKDNGKHETLFIIDELN